MCVLAKNDNKTAVIVRELLEKPINDLGYDVWDVEFLKEGSEWFLRITIDSENGIDINDCEKVHRAIDPLLDDADPIETAYHLEVSSPGIEREIKTEAHIEACLGWDVEVRFYAPIDGKKSICGILAGGDKKSVTIDVNDELIELEMSKVAQIKTVYNFD
jgi:ribosome maturation factor RimP